MYISNLYFFLHLLHHIRVCQLRHEIMITVSMVMLTLLNSCQNWYCSNGYYSWVICCMLLTCIVPFFIGHWTFLTCFYECLEILHCELTVYSQWIENIRIESTETKITFDSEMLSYVLMQIKLCLLNWLGSRFISRRKENYHVKFKDSYNLLTCISVCVSIYFGVMVGVIVH